MAQFYTNIGAGSTTLAGIQENGGLYDINISQDLDANKVKAESGFVSDSGSPVKIQVSGSTVTFTVAGVGSSTLTLT